MASAVRWIESARPAGAALSLLCLPYAGGDGSVFRHWPAALGPGIRVGWAELPGRGDHFGLAPLRRIDAQLQWLLPAVQDVPPPLAIFGYSMGALIGFELAHALRAAGAPPPVLLAVAAHQAPGRPMHGEPLHGLPEPAFVQRLARFHGTPAEVLAHGELLALLSPRLRADFEACETYVAAAGRPPLEMPLVVYGGASDPEVPPAALLHWAALTRARCDCVVFSGHHFFLHSAEQALLRDLGARLT